MRGVWVAGGFVVVRGQRQALPGVVSAAAAQATLPVLGTSEAETVHTGADHGKSAASNSPSENSAPPESVGGNSVTGGDAGRDAGGPEGKPEVDMNGIMEEFTRTLSVTKPKVTEIT